MLEFISPLAFGPIGGIDATVAVFWICVWTVVLGGALVGSVFFFPQWVELEADGKTSHGH